MVTVLVIYPEDGVKGAEALRSLLQKLLFRIEPELGRRPGSVVLKLVEGEARIAMQAQRWKNKKDETLRRKLVKDLATKIKIGDIVVFHHDGDQPWSGQPGSPQHDADVAGLMAEVERLLNAPLPPTFLRIVPHYSLESWLYLNRPAVEKLVESGRVKPEVLVWLDQHRDVSGGYDHLHQPKESCPLSDTWHSELAENWSAKLAAQRSPSWAEAERSWSENTTLRGRLSAPS